MGRARAPIESRRVRRALFLRTLSALQKGGEFRGTSPLRSAQRHGLTRLRGRLSLIGWRLTPEGETGCALSSWAWLRRHW